MENRIVRAHEMRAAQTSKGLSVSGYAARYNVLSHPLPGSGGVSFRERIAHRAFDKILRSKPDVVALVGHNQNLILGRTTSGTLRLDGDSTGLHFEVDLPNTSYARDLHENVRSGNINACSFAFALGAPGEDDTWAEEENETRSRVVVRTINNFSKLFDISMVTTPAYPGTSVDARKELVAAEVRSYVERFLAPLQPKKIIPNPNWLAYCASVGVSDTVSFQDVLEQINERKAALLQLALD